MPHPADRPELAPPPGFRTCLASHQVSSPVPGIASRRVTVLVPEEGAASAAAGQRLPALYLQDGANCLDHDPFGHGGWQVHRALADLTGRGAMAPAVVVLVDGSPRHRTEEYVPGRSRAPGPTADGYLDFLLQAVVPLVDARYPTLPQPASRAIGGSSYGGLISLYAAWTRPTAFGAVLAMSPALAFDFPALVRSRPLSSRPKVYLDSGTVDGRGGDDGRAATARLRDLLLSQGWVAGRDLHHRIGQGHGHSEQFWRERLPLALPLLFPAGAAQASP